VKLLDSCFLDPETGKELRFVTNTDHLGAKTIADLYKESWQIELFFKWIKQNLRVKTFLGTSKNVVLTQIWIALCVSPAGLPEVQDQNRPFHATDAPAVAAQYL